MNRAAPTGPAGHSRTIRLIALFEAVKGLAVLLAGFGLLSLLHRDLHAIALRLVHHAHLNPASRYPQIFVDAASNMQDQRLLWLAAGAAVYAAIRLAEGWGLYRERAWAEVLAAASGGMYVPIELYRLLRHPTWLGAGLLAVNLAVVAVMVHALVRRRRDRARSSQP